MGNNINLQDIQKALIKSIREKEKLNINDFIYDDLTGLLNNQALAKFLYPISLAMIKGMVMNHLNNNTKETYSLFYCDINGLKRVNDAIGHGVANVGIKEIASIIQKSIRLHDTASKKRFPDLAFFTEGEIKKDLAARIGGDEFLVILPNCIKEDAQIIGNRIKENIKHNFVETQSLSLAIGIADTTEVNIPQDLSNEELNYFFNTLCDKAEKRMYRDKKIMYQEINIEPRTAEDAAIGFATNEEKIDYLKNFIVLLCQSLNIDMNDKKNLIAIKKSFEKIKENDNLKKGK